MSFDSSILSTLMHKKTSVQDKLNILTTFENLNYENQFTVISYLEDLCADRSNEVRDRAVYLLNKFVDNFNRYLLVSLTEKILTGLESGKQTKTKIVTLDLITKILSKDNSKLAIPLLITPLSHILSDLSADCSKKGLELFSVIYNKIDNKDINPLIPHLINAMSDSKLLAKSIDVISSTTFVQSVDNLTLSIIVPILVSSFQFVPNAVKRQSIVIIENMTKLVEDAYCALDFIKSLLPLLQYAKTEISEPEIRQVAERAFNQLTYILNKGEEIKVNKDKIVNDILALLPGYTNYHREMIQTMVNSNEVSNDSLSYLDYFNADVNKIVSVYSENYNKKEISTEDINAKLLCDCEFTLGYGSKVLLHKTKLTLYKGYKYGLVGTNNSGKSTLMKAMATRQLESFPQELKSVYVETDILGELSHLSLVDYILQDERLTEENLTREVVEDNLRRFGFTEQMITNGVSTLSGGWRMKLALSRAMMQNADILLMDEPSAHLDVINVKWLLDYINNLIEVTCIIVSQNAKLLDQCCTHIIHISNLKLDTYKGNLSEFVKKHPDAESYFTLTSTKYAFKFPQPRFLDGVKSRGKALMKMDNVTFTYPGNKAPTIVNATVQVSMASRIGCLGPNGAGKSTSIKILTGQLQPDSGTVYTYPGVKIGYIAQHAFAHISEHLDKTANEYIRWRYEGSEDKEDLMKVSMIMSDEDIAKLDKVVMIDSPEGKNKKIKRIINRLTNGRRNGKHEREYEVTFDDCPADLNMWLLESDLVKRGYQKIIKVIDVKCDAAEGMFSVALTQQNVEEHLEKIGMTKENATHVKIKQLSNGEKVKVVIGAALWMRPHILILDEPTNNIDRDGLSALKEAINDFEGGIIVITHDEQFCHSVSKEIWVVENGVLNIKGDPQWMSNAVKEKIEMKQEDEMIDANGNVVKVKQPKKTQLSRKEKMLRDKQKKMRRDLGEEVSEDDD